jgi:hypothetical protein
LEDEQTVTFEQWLSLQWKILRAYGLIEAIEDEHTN